MAGKELREGFTTGACSAAAAKAAVRVLVTNQLLSEIETTLPNKRKVIFRLHRCESNGEAAVCSIIKDAGDDPDCTHGAELIAEVRLNDGNEIVLIGGEGVATVTKPGLGLTIGGPAINPVPRKNITEMVLEELNGSKYTGAEVRISVPGGLEMAKKTMNERLGLVGGISILGTTGIVKPYSTAAYKASVIQAVSVAKELGADTVVLTTGGKSEKFAMDLFPNLEPASFIQVGDFIGTGLKSAAKEGMRFVVVVGMIGKLSKMADGVMMTHRAGSSVNTELLAEIARTEGVPEAVCAETKTANTARHVLELWKETGHMNVLSVLCKRVSENCTKHAGADLKVSCHLVDFDGIPLGQYVA